jgi:purine-binding chemotaxis protein CheW
MVETRTTSAGSSGAERSNGKRGEERRRLEDFYRRAPADRKKVLTAQETVKLIGFRLADEEFGIEIERVKEIGRVPLVTRVSRSPVIVEGIANLRGEILQVLNFHKIMGLSSCSITEKSRIIVLDDKFTFAGIIVDAVSEVMEIEKESLQPPPEIIAGERKRFIKGIIKQERKRSTLWLDCAAIYSEFNITEKMVG